MRAFWYFILTLYTMFFLSGVARADLTYRDASGKQIYKGTAPNKDPGTSCERNEPTNKELKYTVTDGSGNVFSLYCIDKSYYQAYIKRVDAPIEDVIARCLYVGGLNIFNFEVDIKNRFKQIEMISVDPKNGAGLTKTDIVSGIANAGGVATEEWYPKAKKFLVDNKLTANTSTKDFFYTSSGLFPDADMTDLGVDATDLGLDFFAVGDVIAHYDLTPPEAIVAFGDNGSSPYPLLTIDPLMGTPNTPPQETISVSEPSSTIGLVAICGVSAMLGRRLRRSRSAESSGFLIPV